MGKLQPCRLEPSISFSCRSNLSRRQHLNLLSRPNLRYDRRLPQPKSPNMAMGQEPIWPISRSAIRAESSARIAELSTPRQSYTNQDDSKSSNSWHSVSPGALLAQASARIVEMSRPKLSYMVGLTVDMQDRLGENFREKMRSRIIDTLGSSYADLSLGAQASTLRSFYESQSRQSPFRPFSPHKRTEQVLKSASLSRTISAVQSIEERRFWEEARSKPKQDFTIYQPVPERKAMPIWKLIPRLEKLSQVPERKKSRQSDVDPFKVSEAAIRANVSGRVQELAKPKIRKSLDSNSRKKPSCSH